MRFSLKKLPILGLLLALAAPARAQTLISGKVVDRQTGQPVPYASVRLLGTPYGTSSNAEGEFALRVERLPARLAVSQLGYGRDTVAVAAPGALPQPVRLAPAPVQLPAVDQGTFTAELLKKAYRTLVRDHARQLYGQAFYRQLTRLDDRPIEIMEMVWQVKATSAGLEGTAPNQARYARKKGTLINYSNFSFFTRHFALFQDGPDTVRVGQMPGPNAADYYNLRLLGVTESSGQSLAQVAFERKPANNAAHGSGTLTIDLDTQQILRFQVSQDLKIGSNNPLLKFRDGRMTYDYTFRPTPAGAVPEHLLITSTVTMGQLLKSDALFTATAYTYFYGWQSAAPADVTYSPAGTKESDADLMKATAYDPAFWRDNPVVKRTPLEEEIIRSFEQEKAFGTMVAK